MPPAAFVLTSRGLEDVCRDEIAALTGVEITETAYRRVLLRGPIAPLMTLRTADDACLHIATWQEVNHTRAMLHTLREAASALDLPAAVGDLTGVRPIPPAPDFSVTASFVGRRNYSGEEIKQAVAAGVQDTHGWQYAPDERTAPLNLRVFIDHDVALVGLRLGARPLHERGGRAVEREGALKPPVAAAMLRLAGVAAGQAVLDPCCGSGTLLIEAAALGASPLGGDIHPQAVQAARANLRAEGRHVRIDQWDARQLPLPDASVDAVASNLPWGRQITVDDALASLYADLCGEIARTVRIGGRAALLTTAPDLIALAGFAPLTTRQISLYGQTPTVCVFEKRAD